MLPAGGEVPIGDGDERMPESTAQQAEICELLRELLEVQRQLVAAEQVGRSRWLSVEGAAHYGSMSPTTIRSLLASGRLTGYRPVPGKILIDRGELDSLVSSSAGPGAKNGRGKAAARAARQRAGRGK
jgi:excisionase family DNA binding protein